METSGPRRAPPALDALPRPLYSRRETLAPGSWTEEHSHPWCQLSYAREGVLGVRTGAGDFVAPPSFAVWVPPGLPHQVFNRRRTDMRSLYVAPEVARSLPDECCVLRISPLARELILRFGSLPTEYDEAGPAGRLAAVLLDELASLERAGFGLPLPRIGAWCRSAPPWRPTRMTAAAWPNGRPRRGRPSAPWPVCSSSRPAWALASGASGCGCCCPWMHLKRARA